MIPPSPSVSSKKPRSRCKKSNTPRQKKRKRPLLSLRERKKIQSDGNIDASKAVSCPKETSREYFPSPECNINIYAGLEVSSEETNYTVSVLKDFDVLSQSKLIENCNQHDLLQPQKVTNSQVFSQSSGLISLKELMTTQNSNELDNSACANKTQDFSCAQNAVHDELNSSSLANYEFSEWPIAKDCDGISKPISDNQNSGSFRTQSDEHLIGPNNSTVASIAQSDASPKSIVQNILGDFDDDCEFGDEMVTSSPPVVLVRRKNRKTYERTPIAPVKSLIFDDDQHKVSDEEDNLDIGATQCPPDIDIDIELNSTGRIFANLTQLNTFYTQPQTYELDFNADLTHTIDDFDGEFRTFSSNSDDFQCEISNDEQTAIEPDAAENAADELCDAKALAKNDSFRELFDSGDDILVDVETPKAELRSKYAKRNQMSNTTPSTSKLAILSEQLMPKRLRFEPDIEQKEENPTSPLVDVPTFAKRSWTTARGSAIQTSAAALKRTTGLFANIDDGFHEIDPIFNDTPNAKKTKRKDESMAEIENSDFNRNASDKIGNQQFVGFKFAGNSKPKCADTAVKNARNIFQEDFSDLKRQQPGPSFKPIEPVSNSKTPGFTTARGSNIKISDTNLQKYAQTLKEVGQSVCNEFGIDDESNEPVSSKLIPQTSFATARGSSIKVSDTNIQKYAQTLKEVGQSVCNDFAEKDESNANDNLLVCKTPLSKFNQRSSAFTTSTPNPSSTKAFKMCPPTTPIANENLDEEFSWIETLDGQAKDHLCINTQTLPTSRNTSANLNDTIASDIQSMNDSFAEIGLNVLNICDEMKSQRKNALIQQQADCFKKPHPIRPKIGWLLVQKLLDSAKLCDLGSPKKYQRDALERCGVQPNVIDLSVENALKFKFDMWKFYSLEICRTNVDGVDMKDGMKLIMDENSRVGLKEITSSFLQCPSVDPKLVPDHWIENSFKWIVVKLAGFERSFPHEFGGKRLTPENVSNS